VEGVINIHLFVSPVSASYNEHISDSVSDIFEQIPNSAPQYKSGRDNSSFISLIVARYSKHISDSVLCTRQLNIFLTVCCVLDI
jgi:hypothetical protein